MNILFFGDIVGASGREALYTHIDGLKARFSPDFTIANGENAAGGLGMTRRVYEELSSAGIDCFTMGNHTFSKSEVSSLLADGEAIVRPANYLEKKPGDDFAVYYTKSGKKLAVINLLGRVFMEPVASDPFSAADRLIADVRARTPFIFVDFHAEATSEKRALGIYLDGRVSAVIGTHTHVPTADAMILPRGTGYMTDAGMTGPSDSVLGLSSDIAIGRFLTGEKRHYEVSDAPGAVAGVSLTLSDTTGLCTAITPFFIPHE